MSSRNALLIVIVWAIGEVCGEVERYSRDCEVVRSNGVWKASYVATSDTSECESYSCAALSVREGLGFGICCVFLLTS